VASKSRHWPHEDVQSFLNLGERIGPTAKSPKLGELWRLSSLASLLAPKTVLTEGDFVTLEDAWRARRKHPIYKWLDKNEDFRAARSTFQKLQLKAHGNKLKASTAEFVFMRLVVENADLYFRRKLSESRPRGAIKHLRISADKHAGKLLDLFADGLGLSSYPQQKQLEESLRALQIELRSQHRKPYGGSRVAASNFLEYFALQLNIDLDLHSPAIVQDIGDMVGISRDTKACGIYAKRAKERWRAAISEARLRDQPSTTSGQ
jgi:hypothetical protein